MSVFQWVVGRSLDVRAREENFRRCARGALTGTKNSFRFRFLYGKFRGFFSPSFGIPWVEHSTHMFTPRSHMFTNAALARRTDRGNPGQLADGELHMQTAVSRSILRTARRRRSANTNTRIGRANARRRRGTKVGSAEANCVRRASSWPAAVQHSAICEHWSFCQRGRAAPEDTKPPRGLGQVGHASTAA